MCFGKKIIFHPENRDLYIRTFKMAYLIYEILAKTLPAIYKI